MARRKLAPGSKMIHVGVSMPPETWERAQFIARARVPRVSASRILREAIAEYIERRFGATPEREAVSA